MIKHLNEKKQVYAKANISEYWIIDLENRRLIIFQDPQQETYNKKLELNNGLVSCLAFPDVQIEIKKIIGSMNF